MSIRETGKPLSTQQLYKSHNKEVQAHKKLMKHFPFFFSTGGWRKKKKERNAREPVAMKPNLRWKLDTGKLYLPQSVAVPFYCERQLPMQSDRLTVVLRALTGAGRFVVPFLSPSWRYFVGGLSFEFMTFEVVAAPTKRTTSNRAVHYSPPA